MTIDELLELSDAEQKEFLNARLSEGKTPEEIYEALGSDKREMALLGYFYVKGEFMIKPTRGYARTKPTDLG